MRNAIFRLIGGLIGILLLAFGLSAFIPLGQYSVMQPERPFAYLLFGSMFVMYAIAEFDLLVFFRKADIKRKRIIVNGWALVLLSISLSQFCLWWSRGLFSALAGASLSLLLGILLLWIGFRMRDRAKSI
jgi:hypothetical protein